MSPVQHRQHGLIHDEVVPTSSTGHWAIGMAGLVAVCFIGLSIATFVGTPIADDGAGMHFALAVALVVAFALTMIAFTQAVAAKFQQQSSRLLWLPLLTLPALVVYVVFSSRF